MKKWTKEPGRIVIGPDGLVWNQAGLDAGFASVGISTDDDRARVIVNAVSLLTPAQARQFAKVLADAADRAEDLTFKVTATPITKVLVRHSKRIAEEGSE